MDAAEARELIERFTAADKPPTLTADEVDALVRVAVREPSWLPDTAYQTNAVVSSGDFRFIAEVGGVTATAEPTWPADYGDTVMDGTVVWGFGGPVSFDVYGAAAVGWEWKAARVAGAYDTSQQGSSFSRSQMYRACVEQANRFRSMAAGALDAVGAAAHGSRTLTVAPPTLVPYLSARGDVIWSNRTDDPYSEDPFNR